MEGPPIVSEALDVWFLIDPDDGEEAIAEANTYPDGDRFRIEWYLNSVGLVTTVTVPTYEAAQKWYQERGYRDYSS